MGLPAQRHLVRLVGQYNGRPLYLAECDPPAPGRALVRLVGQYNGRPLYVLGECRVDSAFLGAVPMGAYRVRLVGQYNGRPLYVLACCGPTTIPGSASGSEPSPSASLGSESSAVSSASSALSSPAISEVESPASPSLAPSSLSSAISEESPASESPGLSPVPSASSMSSAASSVSEESLGLSSPASESPASSASSGSASPTTGGGGVSVVCCDHPVAEVLFATFGGSLAAIGTVQLTYSQAGNAWEGNANGTCSVTQIRYECNAVTNQFIMSIGPIGSVNSATAITCNPFLWQSTGTAFGGPCAGPFTVEVVD